MISVTPAIKSLKIRNLGLIRKADFKFTKGINIIYGPCASGKTTVINAINHVLKGEKLIYCPSVNKKSSERSEIEVELLGKRISREVERQESAYEACLREGLFPDGRRIPLGVDDSEKLKSMMSDGEKTLFEIFEMCGMIGEGQAVLLDDAFGRLDQEQRKTVFELLKRDNLQVIMTARHEDEFVKGANVIRLKYSMCKK